MDLQDKRALVTGGARRIGREICLALARKGARVAIYCNRSFEQARELARECPGSVVVDADLADPGARGALVRIAAEALDGLDILVNNASVYGRTPLPEIEEEDLDEILEVNLKAPFLLARDAGVTMREAGSGIIVNLTDWATRRPYPDFLPYFAAKAGLESATAGLARAFAPEVRVNAVAPGAILPPDPPDAAYEAEIRAATPLGRFGGADSVVSTVLFLIANEFVTGQTITVDGGRSLR